MAQRVTVVLIDDLDGSEASETVAFGIDGETYEIDLNEDNTAALRESLAPYVKAGRKSGRTSGKGARKTSQSNGTGSGGLSKADRDAVREWSRSKAATKAGVQPLGERGRVPQAAATAWQAR
jgi:hypothetical protein